MDEYTGIEHPTQPPAQPLAQPPTGPRFVAPRRSGVQMLLLWVGVTLLMFGVVTLASLAYAFGEMGRILTIGIIGALALAAAIALTGRLRSTAEGLAWAGLLAWSVDAVLIGGLESVGKADLTGVVTGGILLAITVVSLALHAITRRAAASADAPLRAYSLFAAGALPVALSIALDPPHTPMIVADALIIGALAILGGIACAPHAPHGDAQSARSGTQSERFGTQRAITAIVSTLLLMVFVIGVYDAIDPARRIAATVGFVLMLAFVVLAWMSDVPRRIAPRTPSSAYQPQPQPHPYAPSPAPTAFVTRNPYSQKSTYPPVPAKPQPKPPQNTIRWTVGLIAAATTVTLSFTTRWPDTATMPPDAFCALFGAAALAAGIRQMMLRRDLRSWAALWPGLVFLLVAPLLETWNPLIAPSTIRVALLFVAALVALLAGVALSWQAPTILGAVVLVVHAFSQLWPWIAAFSRDFWWAWLIVAGLLLIGVAARYEASANAMRSFGQRIGQMR